MNYNCPSNKRRGHSLLLYTVKDNYPIRLVVYIEDLQGRCSPFLKIIAENHKGWGTIHYPKKYRGMSITDFGDKYGHGLVFCVGHWK